MPFKYKVICLALLFSSCQKRPGFLDFSPTLFDYKLAKPFILQKGSNLFFSSGSSREIDDSPCFRFNDKRTSSTSCVFLSPDSRWLLVDDEKKLHLINLADKSKTVIGESKSDLYFNFEPNKYRWKNIQWSSNSKYILLIADKQGQASETNEEDIQTIKNEIQIYDIEKAEIKVIGEEETIIDYYFGKNDESIFYSYYKTPYELEVKEISILDSEEKSSRSSFVDSLLFINFVPYDLQNHSTNLLYVITDKWSMSKAQELKDGIYIYHPDTLRLLHESTLSGKNFKGFVIPNHRHHSSFFLPGNRYYAFENYSSEYYGLLLYDIKENRYQKLGSDVKFYFSLTSDDILETKNQKPAYLYKESFRVDLLPINIEEQFLVE